MIKRIKRSYRFSGLRVYAVLTAYGLSLLIIPAIPTSSWAAYSSNGQSVSYSPGNACGGGSCADVCAPFKTNPSGSSGYSTWTTADYNICNTFGIPISPNSTYTPPPSISTTTVPVMDPSGAQVCIIPASITPPVNPQSDPAGACNWAVGIQNVCQAAYVNSQVIPACMAYLAITDSPHNGSDTHCDNSAVANSKAAGVALPDNLGQYKCKGLNPLETDEALASLDLIAAATCAAACASAGNPALMTACSVLGSVEAVTEGIMITKMNSDSASTYADQVFTAIGGAGAAGLGVTNGAGRLGIGTKAGTSGKAGAQELLDTKSAKAACWVTAAAFAAMGGVRIYDAIELQKASADACKNVMQFVNGTCPTSVPTESLLYSSSGSGGNGGGSGGGNGSGNSSGGIGANTSTSGIGGGNGSGASGFDACTSAQQQSGATPAQAGNTCFAQTAQQGATDSGMLNQLGPGGISSQVPSLSGLYNQAAEQGAGAALGGMLPASMGSTGAALANLAQAAQNDGAKIAGAMGMAPVLSTYSGGGAATANGGGDNGTIAGLLGMGSSGGGGMGNRNLAQASFGNPSAPDDIFHSHSKVSIFDIVSHAILHDTYKVLNNGR